MALFRGFLCVLKASGIVECDLRALEGDVKDFVADLECYYRQTLAPGDAAHADTGR